MSPHRFGAQTHAQAINTRRQRRAVTLRGLFDIALQCLQRFSPAGAQAHRLYAKAGLHIVQLVVSLAKVSETRRTMSR